MQRTQTHCPSFIFLLKKAAAPCKRAPALCEASAGLRGAYDGPALPPPARPAAPRPAASRRGPAGAPSARPCPRRCGTARPRGAPAARRGGGCVHLAGSPRPLGARPPSLGLGCRVAGWEAEPYPALEAYPQRETRSQGSGSRYVPLTAPRCPGEPPSRCTEHTLAPAPSQNQPDGKLSNAFSFRVLKRQRNSPGGAPNSRRGSDLAARCGAVGVCGNREERGELKEQRS